MKGTTRIAYSFIVGDLLHYGHLKMLETAKEVADYHICGVLSDAVAEKWIAPLICSYEERKGVIENIKFVDEVMRQDSMDPTDNLKHIHKKHPAAKIFLIQNHSLGENVLGVDFIKEINGGVIERKFYTRLSREYIAKSFFNSFSSDRLANELSFNDILFGNISFFRQHFSTKANTLNNLKKVLRKSIIEKEFIFTVSEWEKNGNAISKNVFEIFNNEKIIVRSSNKNEDTVDFSNAGSFKSVLNIDACDQPELKRAINEVIDSYREKDSVSPQNQILIQKQTEGVEKSGVVFTRNLWTNTPYYLINYDAVSKKTDTVTSGMVSNRVEILRDILLDDIDEEWQGLISAVKEIENIFKGIALDIEFAVKRTGEIVIFQVRPLAANQKFSSLSDGVVNEKVNDYINKYRGLHHDLLSKSLILSDMSFWNPAELIGDRPNYLSYSLFNHLIMKDKWNEALLPLGYSEVNDGLLVLLGNKPYINVHHSLLALMPANLPLALKRKLMEFYCGKLADNPALHDKIEFEIVHNCYTLDVDEKMEELNKSGFSHEETATLKAGLLELTNGILDGYPDIVNRDKQSIEELAGKYFSLEKNDKDRISWRERLELVYRLIEDCKSHGIGGFVRLARMAFIGNALLRSLRDLQAISQAEFDDFFNSIETITMEMDLDFVRMTDGSLPFEKFIEKYGHLRPGTYDITKLPYRKNLKYFDTQKNGEHKINKPRINASIDDCISGKIAPLLEKHGIRRDARRILAYIRQATELREKFKFIYTKNISLGLEMIAASGDELGLSREDLANLDYYSIVNNRDSCTKEELLNIWNNLIASRREELRINGLVSLPALVFSEKDFQIVHYHDAKPNFVTDLTIEGQTVFLDEQADILDINGKIVVIEKADPGFDWIFTKKIKALITKYGGVASHMAIRAAEFSIPAAIGCGEIIFSKIKRSSRIILDCKNKTIHTM